MYTCGRRRRCIVPKKTNVKENKTMKKKVVAMFLAAVMALSLMACGSKSDNGGSGDASGT